jgi:hypothetical protein
VRHQEEHDPKRRLHAPAHLALQNLAQLFHARAVVLVELRATPRVPRANFKRAKRGFADEMIVPGGIPGDDDRLPVPRVEALLIVVRVGVVNLRVRRAAAVVVSLRFPVRRGARLLLFPSLRRRRRRRLLRRRRRRRVLSPLAAALLAPLRAALRRRAGLLLRRRRRRRPLVRRRG